jgi:hypothetical protein
MFHLPLSDSTLSEDAGIEPGTAATSALAVKRFSHSAKSHPQLGYISSTTRLHLIHTRLHLIHSRLHLIHSRLHLIHTRLHLIHNSATSHPQYSSRCSGNPSMLHLLIRISNFSAEVIRILVTPLLQISTAFV